MVTLSKRVWNNDLEHQTKKYFRHVSLLPCFATTKSWMTYTRHENHMQSSDVYGIYLVLHRLIKLPTLLCWHKLTLGTCISSVSVVFNGWVTYIMYSKEATEDLTDNVSWRSARTVGGGSHR